MLGKHMRHLNRYKDIVVAFSKNGLGYVMRELGLHDLHILPRKNKQEKPVNDGPSLGVRIRRVLEELGPTFVKFGQVMSTRPDLLPEDIINELEKLQATVPPFSFEKAKAIIEKELNQPIEDLFVRFDEEPIAAASIGQVHRAKLPSGEEVAVKVQRPEISEKIDVDFEILTEMAALAELRLDWAKQYRLKDVIEEMKDTLNLELDYTIEAHNMIKIGDQFKEDERVIVPKAYLAYTTKEVLVMEYVEGMKLKSLILSPDKQGIKEEVAEKLVNITLKQILMDGFFHADPHPGNILLTEDNAIILLDFGMVGQLTEEMKRQFGQIVIAMTKEDTEMLVEVIFDMGVAPDNINRVKLTNDVDMFMHKYYRQSLHDISLAEAVQELFQIAYRHRIEMPSDFTLLGKTLLTLEGTVEQLDPTISIVEIAEPFGKQLIRDRFHPKNLKDQFVDQWIAFYDLWRDLPSQAKALKRVVKKGKVHVELSLPDIDLLLRKMDRISNQLSFAIILLAFSIIMVGIIVGAAIMGASSILWRLPMIEVGAVVAMGMFLWIIFAIFKSGRF
ncbi:2-octaprenylphenol hydroxylase [Streptohalobacillus salinus]|uniref:2-octaprenylphenol hydroxylase n=1 Tax=Streptohalobacillus salinus TaxID=621096 RepID=A0A2V3W9N8_9BACI|nr:AarF/ABC1/UbiB kinase family protein [Streptohalobacillus salinus]PXW91087.1 2-octaprenylphenol hydroxylase [Streptohalobacillus salinus]